MKNISITKKTAIIAGVIVLSLTGGVGASMANKTKAGADPTWPIVTEVDQQKDKLANHEARITNLENSPQTTGSSTQSKVPVPVVRDVTVPTGNTVPSNGTNANATLVTVVKYQEIPLDANNSDCEYTYSDGSTHRFNWKKTNPHGSWVTDGNDQNGRWTATSTQNGICDDSAIGLPKN